MEQEIEVIREQEEQEIEIQNENITVEVVVNNNYEELTNKPKINNVELNGNKTSSDLGLQPAGNYVIDNNYTHTDNNFTNEYKNNVDLNTRDRHTHANKAVLDGISSNDITNWNNKSDFSGSYDDLTDKPTIPDVSNFITKDVNDLTYYTLSSNLATVATSGSYNDLTNKPDLSGYATTTSLGNETTARENADVGLQEQIDAITSSSDVKDIVGTYTDLQNYDTTTLGNDDIIKVLQDNTHNNAMTYYRWVITGGTGSWQYIGQEGPYYTKGETDTLLNGKQNEITNNNKLLSDLVDDTNQNNLFVSSNEKQTWNNKLDSSALTNYVTNTDYATSSIGGVIRTGASYGTTMTSGGNLRAVAKTYAEYSSAGDYMFVGKKTLENVITGKELNLKKLSTFDATKTQVLKNINGTLTWINE